MTADNVHTITKKIALFYINFKKCCENDEQNNL
jgi:hypothetical protein